ncbi:MAG TPA: sugar phosphate isomerase/epimerase [Bryobacteraceae bacterium]|nr:sugar phosphate isomerase/epimerase [Bryobacteraceae bacterium]
MSGSRRQFVQSVANGAIGAAWLGQGIRPLRAAFPLGLPPGLQLWSIKEDLAKAEDDTLRRIARIGYRELEHYEMPRSPAAFRRKCDDAGLKLVSAHFDMPLADFGSRKTIDGAREMGLQYMMVVFPALRSLRGVNVADMNFSKLSTLYEKISLDDYKWNAERFNSLGAQVKKAGMQLGYHNHAIDLKKSAGGVAGFDALIQGTDPDLVVFEMDCGHMIHAGSDPIAYLRKYPGRIAMLHIKDLKAGYAISTTLDTEDKDTDAEIGAGVIDWKRLFSVIRPGDVKHWFVEQEGKMDHAPMESIAISYHYLKQM